MQLVTYLTNACALVIVLEDVQWADAISLRMLAVVSRRLRARQLMIVVTAREEEIADNATLSAFVCGAPTGRAPRSS